MQNEKEINQRKEEDEKIKQAKEVCCTLLEKSDFAFITKIELALLIRKITLLKFEETKPNNLENLKKEQQKIIQLKQDRQDE